MNRTAGLRAVVLRPPFLVGVAAFVGVALAGVACSRSGGRADAAFDAPCVVLVTIEGLRADRLGFHGGTNAFTPVLDGLARDGAVFLDMQAATPLTLPAHATLMSGLQPPEHGVRDPHGRLPEGTRTLATGLRAAGYRTAAFVAQPALLRDNGLQQGFAQYRMPPPRVLQAPPRLRPRPLPALPDAEVRRGEAVLTMALEWLADTAGIATARVAHAMAQSEFGAPAERAPAPAKLKQPFFLWIQFSDLAFRDSPEQTQVSAPHALDGYGAELAYIDLQIGRLLTFLRDHGLRDRTLMVVAGSHGDATGPPAGPDGALTLSDAVLHVPALLNWPGRIDAGLRWTATCNQTVLAPTVADLLQQPTLFPPPVAARRVGAWRHGEKTVPDGAMRAYVESLWPRQAYGLPPLIGWTDATWRYVRGVGLTARNGDVAQPPPPDPQEAAQMLAAIEAAFLPGTLPTLPPPLPDAAFTLPDGWDRREYVRLWRDVARRLASPSADDERLLADCRRLVEGRPDQALFHGWQGIAHTLRKETPEAVAAHRRALALAPGDPRHMYNLGLALLDAGNAVAAIDKLENAYLARTDDDGYRDTLAAVLMNVGVTLAQARAFQDALACMTRVLLLQPYNPVAHFTMGTVYRSMGRTDLAAASFRRTLELKSDFRPAQQALEALQKEVP